MGFQLPHLLKVFGSVTASIALRLQVTTEDEKDASVKNTSSGRKNVYISRSVIEAAFFGGEMSFLKPKPKNIHFIRKGKL